MQKTTRSTGFTHLILMNYEFVARTMSVRDTRPVALTKEVIAMYGSQKKYPKAEKIMVSH